MSVSSIVAIVMAAISIIITIFGIGSFVGSAKKDIKSSNKKVEELEACVHALDIKVTKISTQIEPFWNIIETRLATVLHSPHTPRYDELLSNFHNIVDMKELSELQNMLEDDLEESKLKGDLSRVLTITLVLSRVAAKVETTRNTVLEKITTC